MDNTAARLRLVLHQSFSLLPCERFSHADSMDRYSRVQVSRARRTGHGDNYSIIPESVVQSDLLFDYSFARISESARSRSRSIGIVWISAKHRLEQCGSINRVNRKLPPAALRRDRGVFFLERGSVHTTKTLRRSTMPIHLPY